MAHTTQKKEEMHATVENLTYDDIKNIKIGSMVKIVQMGKIIEIGEEYSMEKIKPGHEYYMVRIEVDSQTIRKITGLD